MNTLLCVSILILSIVALVAILGAFGMNFFVHKEDKKIEVIISDNDNPKKLI